ncbi:hypothetical protein K438DRAFT_2113283 [Mycena galopus ATCC 62051]|nr:hypothetical protein K438DRAFT_2113283 [Mycena galopus ATCC 62051]
MQVVMSPCLFFLLLSWILLAFSTTDIFKLFPMLFAPFGLQFQLVLTILACGLCNKSQGIPTRITAHVFKICLIRRGTQWQDVCVAFFMLINIAQGQSVDNRINLVVVHDMSINVVVVHGINPDDQTSLRLNLEEGHPTSPATKSPMPRLNPSSVGSISRKNLWWQLKVNRALKWSDEGAAPELVSTDVVDAGQQDQMYSFGARMFIVPPIFSSQPSATWPEVFSGDYLPLCPQDRFLSHTGTLNTFGLPFKLWVADGDTSNLQGDEGATFHMVKGDEGVPPPPPPPAHDNDGAAAASGDKGDEGVPPLSLPPAHNKDGAAAASADEGAIPPPPPPSGNGADADDEKADTKNRGAPAPLAKVKRGRKGAVKKTAGRAAKKSAPKMTVPTPKKRGQAKETDEDVTENPPTKWCRVPGGPAVAAAHQARGLAPSPKKRKAIES